MYIGYVPDEVSFAESAAAAILTLRATASSPGETYQGESTGPEAVYNFEGKAISTHIDVSVSTAFEAVHRTSRTSSTEGSFVLQRNPVCRSLFLLCTFRL